ncbi:MAG TPA: pepsin/retropepsin-like aspartic protease family protein [Pyrinomonadaceae bacterium]
MSIRAKLFIALGALVAMGWAVPSAGTAPFLARANGEIGRAQPLPRPARLRINKARGLLLSTWINGRGPYVFAVDTGAGMNVVTQRVVSEAQLITRSVRPTVIGGLTSARTTSNREAVITQLALGDQTNILPATRTAVIVSILAPGVDGILDPTDVYSPYGYSIDMPNQRIEAVDSFSQGSQDRRDIGEGAVVPWLRFGDSFRPFVRLGDGRLALVDTGSNFGLAVNSRNAVIVGNRRGRRPSTTGLDVAGGEIDARRVSPTTIRIGELVLQRVPTDILFGVEDDAPVILGRDVLYPFKITFDPQKRLIEFVTSAKS